MSDEIKRMDIKEFRDRGYLHEVNRLVLHPLGMALEVVVDKDGTERLGGVWDGRDAPEGIYYDEALLSLEKAHGVCQELLAKKSKRYKALGYVVQPFKGEIVLTTNYTAPGALDA